MAANLPPRPDGYSRYVPDDRHFSGQSRSIAPMRTYDDRDPRGRSERDVYIARSPPRSRSYIPRDSYVAPSHDRRDGDRFRDYRPEWEAWDRDQDRARDNERRAREIGRESEREHEHERGRGRESYYPRDNRRGYDRNTGARDVPHNSDRERHQVYDKPDREYERRRQGQNRWDLQSRSRWDSRPESPPRRMTTQTHSDIPSQRSPKRSSMSPRHRPHHSNIRPRSRSHSITRSRSRERSPPTHLGSGNNHISNYRSPRSPGSPRNSHRLPMQANEHDVKQRRSTHSASPPRPPPRDVSPDGQHPSALEEHPPGSVLSPQSEKTTEIEMKPPPTSCSPTPGKPDPTQDAAVAIEEKTTESKPEEKPLADVAIQMRDRSPSPPRHPRNVPSRPYQRSPPRAPRNYPKPSAGPASPAQFHHSNPPTKPDWANRNMTSPNQGPRLKADTLLPVVPTYKPQRGPTVDNEVTRLQAHRAHLKSEYVQIARSARRALHELDMSTIDLRAAEKRRKVANEQMEKARAGVLGIDAVPAT